MEENKTLNPEVSLASKGNMVVAIAVGVATAVAFGLGGFLLIKDEFGSMGGVLFLLLPFATGFATALIVKGTRIITASIAIGAVICTAILLLSKMEGWVCVLMSMPLIAVGMTVGALFGVLVRRKWIDKSRLPNVISLVLLVIIPFFLVGASNAEKPSRRTSRVETVTSRFAVDAPPEVVWNQVTKVDKITGSKGFLMTIGLPVPVSCALQGEGVGATRTCYFESGHIEERVAEWNPPNSMKLEITASDVPGRPWLSFRDASYDIHQENGQTVVTRTTTIISRLSPAIYWRPLEKIGVETEHEYLFEEFKRRINGAK
jgi:hypothetical protein